MTWTPLQFSKHKGKTLPQIVFADPDWFFWAIEEGVFKGAITSEAKLINTRARTILIPNNANGVLVAEYYVHQPTQKFGGMQIVPKSQPQHQGSSPAFRQTVIDLSIPRKITAYDKLGCKTLVTAAKRELFGSSSTRMTQARCEEFFDNPSNFV